MDNEAYTVLYHHNTKDFLPWWIQRFQGHNLNSTGSIKKTQLDSFSLTITTSPRHARA
jgi:hypothetical protein